MRVRYQDVERHLEPYYQCTEAVVRRAGKLYQSVRGRPIDEAVSALLLESVAPAAIEVALAVQEEIAHRIDGGAIMLRHVGVDRGYWRDRAVCAPDPRLRTAARWSGAAAELALCSTTRPAITAPQLRDELFYRLAGGHIMLAA
jgi:hypothetical protein